MSRVVTSDAYVSETDLRNSALNILGENYQADNIDSSSTLVSQRVNASLVGIRVGRVVTNVIVNIATLGVGTAPTAIYVALYTSAGARLAVSADVSANFVSPSTTGMIASALSAPYTITASGGYYLAILEDGAFGTTALALGRSGTGSSAASAAAGGVIRWGLQNGQATMPSTLTLTANSTPNFWMGWN